MAATSMGPDGTLPPLPVSQRSCTPVNFLLSLSTELMQEAHISGRIWGRYVGTLCTVFSLF